MMPKATLTFKECLVPYCGISMKKSHRGKISSESPNISFPITNTSSGEGKVNVGVRR
jgi:hypothetical protein